jgi:hypothetical protein
MKIAKVAPPINGGAIWSGEAVSECQHYFWMADQGGKGCQAQSGRLKERGTRFGQWRPVFPIFQVAS